MKELKEIAQKKIKRYLEITEKARETIYDINKNIKNNKNASQVIDMAERYFKDAKYYYKKGDFVTAFACVNYAHGWIDCGARLGLYKVPKGTGLFTE